MATVWPQPAATSPGQWQAAILTLATRYTPPDAQVLLLDPPWMPSERDMDLASPAGWWTGPGEAAQAVARLGRWVHVRTANTFSTSGTLTERSESGPRPTAASSGTDHCHRQRRRCRRNRPEQAPVAVDKRPRFDLIASAVAPHDPGWVTTVAFADLLTPAGTLAILTYADNTGPQLVDPTGLLVDTLSDRGLVWVDHIILPTAPLDDPGPATTRAGSGDPSVLAGARHRVTHGDLLLFGPPARRVPRRHHNEETPDA